MNLFMILRVRLSVLGREFTPDLVSIPGDSRPPLRDHSRNQEPRQRQPPELRSPPSQRTYETTSRSGSRRAHRAGELAAGSCSYSDSPFQQ